MSIGPGWYPEERGQTEKEYDDICVNLLKLKLQEVWDAIDENWRRKMEDKSSGNL
jgi:hypothetical protein